MTNIKFILFALILMVSLTFKKRTPNPVVVTKIIEPTKHYTDVAPWHKFTKEEIINNKYPKRKRY